MKFAEGTAVPVSKSRGEIDAILRAWGAAQVQWADDWERGAVLLRFVWVRKADKQRFQARMVVQLSTDAALREQARYGGQSYARVMPGKLQKLQEARGRREHRVLLLWLKAAFNAIDLGIITAEELFLSFIEGADGRTVSEMALPGIARLLSPGGGRLLLGPSTEDSP